MVKKTAGKRSRKTGPRGGKSTLSADGTMHRKSFFLELKYSEALKREAFEREIPESEIIRELIARHYPDAAD